MLFQTHTFDAVAHFAASIEAGESMVLPGKYFENNVACTNRLLEAMTRHGVRKLIFSSTAGVYASKDEPLSEDDPAGPANVYGETKLMIERMLEWYHRVAGLSYAALRYFNACGAMLAPNGTPIRGEAHEPETHLIPLTLQVPLGQRDAIMIYGTDYNTPDGTCIRDYIHVADLAAAHTAALRYLRAGGESLVANCGYGHGFSVRQVLKAVERVAGHGFDIRTAPRRPGDPASVVSDPALIKATLGWTPAHDDLDTIVGHALGWEARLRERNR